PAGEFYHRLQNYVRFKTPELSPTALLQDPASPLQIIERLWQEPIQADDREKIARLVEQFKLLRAILRRTLDRTWQRHWQHFIVSRIAHGEVISDAVAHKAERVLSDHLAVIQTILGRFRAHADKVAGDNIPERLRYSYRLTDEAISVVIEGNLLKAMRTVASLPGATLEERLTAQLAAAIQCELTYRQQQGYQSLLIHPAKSADVQRTRTAANNGQRRDANERYLYHLSLLKKYTSSVLFLATVGSEEGRTVEQLLFALAAGISMIFATVVAFYAQSAYGNLTTSLFMALVVGYMFKDRIKEIGRSLSKTLLRRYFYDRRTYIYTLDRKQRLGRVREKMVFESEDNLPPQVKAAYANGQISPIEIDGSSEHIIHYARNVRLIADAFRKVRREGVALTGLSDILRLDIRPFLHKMDNPTERRYYLDGDTLRTIQLNRVYYINVISTYQLVGEEQIFISQNVRVTLNRTGLVRVEKV
ncbi:MAG: hypothetical protein KDE19_06370, partial [Caldilineaceae bacterium]|nr:hypothetical protein [Caldilineaceae bacterium]